MSDATDFCANCGGGLGGAPYCAQCGQRVVEDRDFSLIHLTQAWVKASFGLDSRGLTTLRRLLFQPGRLSADYIAGRRGATFSPFQVFVLASVAFFLLPDNVDVFKAPAQFFFGDAGGLVDKKMGQLGMSRDELALAYDARVSAWSKLGLILITGPLCLVSWIMGVRRVPQIGKHLVMGVYALVFVMILMAIALGPFVAIVFALEIQLPRLISFLIVLLPIALYFAVQQRRVLGSSVWVAGVKGLILMAVFFATSTAYRYGIAWLTLWSL